MNYLKSLTLICLIFSLVSCSSSDDSNDSDTTLAGNYFPSSSGDFWNYNVVNTDVNNPAGNFSATDLLTVATTSGNSFTLDVNNNTSPANGTLNALLVNGNLSRTEDKLTFNGNLQLPAEFDNLFDQTVTLTDVVLYDLNASNNQELSSNSETLTQDLVLDTQTFPITIEYSFTTTKIGNSNSETVNGTNYLDVTKTRLSLSLNVYTEIEVLGSSIPYSIIETQEVLSIDAYFAKNVGLIKAFSETGYQISDQILDLLTLLSIDLGFPENNSGTNTQELGDYAVTSS